MPDRVESLRPYAEAIRFAEEAIAAAGDNLPRAAVVDAGWICGRGWAVIEANTASMSAIYDCEPLEVLRVLRLNLVSAGD